VQLWGNLEKLRPHGLDPTWGLGMVIGRSVG
jgi:hypothetical protein